MRKKILLLFTCLLLTLTLFGCQKEKPLNHDRGTDYQFDFIDLINVTVYGSNGKGFIEVRPKDLKLGDANIPEDQLISLMRFMDEIGLYVGPDQNIASRLRVTNNYNISNGEAVCLYFDLEGYTPSVTDITVNLEPYYFIVDSLPEGVSVDLFDNKSVIFYGLEGTKDVYPLKLAKGNIPQDVYDYLVYSASVEGESTVQENKSILVANAFIDEGALNGGSDPAFTTETYLGRRGLVAETTKEKILTKVVPQLNVNAIDSYEAEKAIKSYLENQTIIIQDKVYSNPTVMTLQVRNDNLRNTNVTSDYTTSFRVSGSDGTLCLALPIRLVSVDGQYLIPEAKGNMQAMSNDVCGSAMNGYTMIANYNAPVVQPELPSQEEGEVAETENVEETTNTNEGGE